jgi:hypothetical protein
MKPAPFANDAKGNARAAAERAIATAERCAFRLEQHLHGAQTALAELRLAERSVAAPIAHYLPADAAEIGPLLSDFAELEELLEPATRYAGVAEKVRARCTRARGVIARLLGS